MLDLPLCTKDKAGTPGKITRLFLVVCYICEEKHIDFANNPEDFIQSIDKDWRLSREHGWTHKKCCKLMPCRLKWKAK